MKMNILKSFIGVYFLLVCSNNVLAQYSLVGPTSADVGDTDIYSVVDGYGYPPYGQYPYFYEWYADGTITASNSYFYGAYYADTISVLWDYPGTNYIYVDIYDDYYNDYYYYDIAVVVTGTIPDNPGSPTASNNVCNPTITRSGTPPSGVTWYWQGKNSNGTSTSLGSGATYTPTDGSGTYYIRARDNASGVWSLGSGSASVTVVSGTLWYTDTDNDGFGDPNSSPISGCTQPSGRVSNNFDQCPTSWGPHLNNGCPGSGDPGSTDKNYVHTVSPLIAVSNVSQITNNDDKLESVTYYDGLGRAIQSVGIRAGGQGQDIKVPVVYDEFGRQARTYLPHATVTSSVSSYTSNTTLISDLNTYYVSKYGSQLNSSNPNAYSEARHDGSPLSRVLESGTPGEDWLIDPNSDNDHTTKYGYNSNQANQVYKIDYPGAGQSLSISSYYTQGVLLKNTVKNSNWVTTDGSVNTKDVFTDKGGRKIAEFSYEVGAVLKTYYVYDDKGNMVYVLTPKIFTVISGTTISVTNLNDLAFQYKYDTYNRQIEQKVPGKEWEYLVYDQLDRPILTQDENLKDDGKWLFTKYDAFGRAVYSGLFTSSSSRSTLQAAVDSYISGNTNNLSNIETRIPITLGIGGVSINYSNNAYPTSGLEVLTVNYYDDYGFTDSSKPATPTTILGQTVTTDTRGLSTASWTKTLGASSWTKHYTYYDDKGRVIYVYEKNYLGGFTENKSKLDFRGKVENSTTTHRKGTSGSILTIQDRFEYDHVERPEAQYQIVNSNTEERISQNSYDELGQLIQKGIGGTSGVSLQTLDYVYDIRGALKSVNDVDNMGSDLFAYELNYETGEGSNFNAPQYNGNISQMVWKSAHNNIKKSYYYDYDDLNRFEKGRYGEGSGLTTNWQKFEVSVNGYDDNGNITGVTRRGLSSGTTIDNLTYYYNSGNQLMKIVDASGTSGFKNGTNSGDDYAYDDNGNLTKDLNKNISLIEYNHLDLVEKVTFTDGKRIEFDYDASGAKLQMRFVNGGSTTTTDYIGGFQYTSGTLQFFPTSEGYVKHNAGTYSYVYSLRDHLGNNRVSFERVGSNNVILSSTDYYPMGMTHYGEHILNSNYNYKYQGKEKLLANGYNMYDFGSRMYDASVGRWFNTDPQNQFGSPYLAMGNNWVVSVDPDGEFAQFIIAGAFLGIMKGIHSNQINGRDPYSNIGGIAGSAGKGALTGLLFGMNGVVADAIEFGTMGKASVDISITDNFSLTLSPAIAFGSSKNSFGLNLSANYDIGDFTLSASASGSYYNKAVGTGKSGFGSTFSRGLSYDDGKTGFSLYSTNYSNIGGVGKQKVGGLGFRSGDFNFRYENDGFPFGGNLGDGNDSYRSAALKLGVGNYSVGFNLFTGFRNDYSGDEDEQKRARGIGRNGDTGSYGERYPNGFVKETGTAYRLGALYFGYKNYRVGINSDRHVRHPIQNRFAHGVKAQPGFRSYSSGIYLYTQYKTQNPFSLW